MNTEFGLLKTDIEKIKNTLATFPEIEKAVLYGSRAKGNFKVTSDIDLTLTGNKLSTATISSLECEIDDLLLPYTFDISIINKISNIDLIAHIERVGKIFYQKND
jgi:predicted nucleotidyltransferase